MIPIKNTLADFILQIENLADKIFACQNTEELYIYLRTYKTYCYLYGLNEKCKIFIPEIEENGDFEDLLNKESSKYFSENDTFFLQEKDKLQNILLRNLNYLITFLDSFAKSSYYKRFEKLYNKKLDKNELYDILISYFKDENKEMLHLFEELMAEERFYRLKDERILKSNALSIFNPLEKKSNVLIRKDLIDLRFLEAYVHETAHVYDSNNLSKTKSEVDVSLYNSNSFFNETLSTAYSLDLYNYLIKNSLYKDYAVIGLVNTLLAYSLSLDSACLLCALTQEDYLNLYSYLPTKKEIIKMLRKNSQNFPLNENISNEYLEEEVDVSETIQYTYGYLLSKTLLSDKANFSKFLDFRDKNLTIAELKSKGFDLDTNPKILTKHLEEYLD